MVHSMDRLARSLDDLRRLVRGLTEKGVQVRFVKEGLTFTGDDKPMSNLLLSMLSAVAEFERSMIRERQREGIELAKKKGIYKGRKPSLTVVQIAEIRKRVRAGEKKSRLAAEFRISRQLHCPWLKVEAGGCGFSRLLAAGRCQGDIFANG